MVFTNWNAVAVIALLSVLSGVAVFLQGVREERIKRDWWNFLTEVLVAVISGACAYFAGAYYRWEEPLVYLSVLVASNNGRETVNKGKDVFLQAIQAIFMKKGL